MRTSVHARYRNALIGLAAGDAWGYQVEFCKYSQMPDYPVPAPKKIWRVSDDTQMTLALHSALVDVSDRLDDVDAVTKAITARFLEWQVDRDNNRAPGATCMGSLSRLRRGAHWSDTDGALAKPGCGAVMRLAPAALSPEPVWLGITALQAALTHKHPRAIASALVLSDAIRSAPGLCGYFLEHAISVAMSIVSGESLWLSDEFLLRVLAPMTSDVRGLLTEGIKDVLLDALLDAYAVKQELATLAPAEYGDPCVGIGEGWESGSATAVGLLVADMASAPGRRRAPLDGREALGWAATSNGDSDSIASIAGAVIGAAHTRAGYWATVKLNPRFEPRYAKALGSAPTAARAYLADYP
ncbi:ADP-ribosyl-[dinitrogen reductase] glycohydrolase [Mycobacterium marinum]|uniref:ADP-ribosylglycohydrolase family protein n=1 Tax=Mycobacterium marinum TaxID=1781 RepID=UPI000E3BA1B2|nr:ADP-ribosylglycohydrolase family protein [Mycobacterium marinum]RFZ63200.1 ADP-ribosyl-[dinitrogen reductase] glycohydrolase [Mycobacterium marinum]